MLYQMIQLLGAGVVFYAYVLLQQGKAHADQLGYGILNLIGATTLLGVAIAGRQWGFCVLNAAWIMVAGRSAYRAFVRSGHRMSPVFATVRNHDCRPKEVQGSRT